MNLNHFPGAQHLEQPPEQWLVSWVETWGQASEVFDVLHLHGEVVHFPARATIFREGDPSDSMYLVVSGMCLVLTHDENGVEHTLSIVTEGQSFGELGVLLQRPRLATVAAGLDCELLKITPDMIEHLETQHPALAARLYKALAKTLAEQWLRGGTSAQHKLKRG